MQKILSTICALIVAFIFPLAFLVSRWLPADTGSLVGKKYAGWNGVLQAWVCCEWSAGDSFIAWLNRCAADFEKAHNGVYLEFISVNRETMAEMMHSGLRLPELIFFSLDVLTSAEGLIAHAAPARLRSDLQMDDHVLPIAMGGYIWVYNTALADGAPMRSSALRLSLLPDGDGRHFAPATIALLSDLSGEGETDMPVPEVGLDLGLPVSNPDHAEISTESNALKAFINGDLPQLIVTQKELKQLDALRASGRCADWRCASSGQFAWCDQLLLLGCMAQSGTAAAEREALAWDFACTLLEAKQQQMLADIGAFSVCGETIHSAASVYAEMDGMLNRLPLCCPKVFSEYSLRNPENIVRDYCDGKIGPAQALENLGLEFTSLLYPN